MKYKAILFDMDGTLLDTLTDMADAVNHILSVHGWPLRTTEEVRAFVGNGARRLMERAVPPEVTGGDFEAVLTEYRDWYQAHNCVATAPYPGIPALLAALAEAGMQDGGGVQQAGRHHQNAGRPVLSRGCPPLGSGTMCRPSPHPIWCSAHWKRWAWMPPTPSMWATARWTWPRPGMRGCRWRR